VERLEELEGALEAFAEGGEGNAGDGAGEGGTVHLGGDGDLRAFGANQAFGGGVEFFDEGDQVFDVGEVAGEVEDVGAGEVGFEAADEGEGDVFDVLEVHRSGQAHFVGFTEDGGAEGVGGIGGHAEIAAGAVDGPGAEADGGGAGGGGMDAGAVFVGLLEDAVEGGGVEGIGFGEGAAGVQSGWPPNGGGGGVHDGESAGGFEEVEGAEDIDAGAEDGIALADGDQQGGEVADVGDGVGGEEAVDQGAVLDGAFDGGDLGGDVRRGDEVEAFEAGVEIEGDDAVALLDEKAGDPGADAPGGAGEKYIHRETGPL